MTQSRFARALLQYLANHSQLELSEASGVERSIISRIANGRRPPTQEAARAIITGTTGPHRIDLLRAWLEDQIPDRCAGLVTITATEPATIPTTAKATPETDEQRALAWLEHQLATNVHSVHMVIDLWRASGSPSLPLPQPVDYTTLTFDDGTHGTARAAEPDA